MKALCLPEIFNRRRENHIKSHRLVFSASEGILSGRSIRRRHRHHAAWRSLESFDTRHHAVFGYRASIFCERQYHREDTCWRRRGNIIDARLSAAARMN